MAGDNIYDMKQKLLQLQNELLKDAQGNPTPSPSVNKPDSPQPAEVKQDVKPEIKNEDMLSLLKDIRITQQKMLALLVEINNKLK